jgi:hypothetical protein
MTSPLIFFRRFGVRDILCVDLVWRSPSCCKSDRVDAENCGLNVLLCIMLRKVQNWVWNSVTGASRLEGNPDVSFECVFYVQTLTRFVNLLLAFAMLMGISFWVMQPRCLVKVLVCKPRNSKFMPIEAICKWRSSVEGWFPFDWIWMMYFFQWVTPRLRE